MKILALFFVLFVLGSALFSSTPAGPSPAVPSEPPAPSDDNEALGVGIVRPRILTGARLYFYNRPRNFDTMAYSATPVDSLVFGEGWHHVPIAYAPPWFVPEYMHLDYDALLLRAVTVSQNWVEVIVNTSSPRPRMFPHMFWVARESVEFSYWPDFLLNVAAVEVLDASANPVRIGPSEQASVVPAASQPLLRPLAIQDHWMQIALVEGSGNAPIGWIRWRDDDQLTITYSLTM